LIERERSLLTAVSTAGQTMNETEVFRSQQNISSLGVRQLPTGCPMRVFSHL